jgi:hypothetical protein
LAEGIFFDPIGQIPNVQIHGHTHSFCEKRNLGRDVRETTGGSAGTHMTKARR